MFRLNATRNRRWTAFAFSVCLFGIGSVVLPFFGQESTSRPPIEVKLSAQSAQKLLLKRVTPVWPKDLQEVTGMVVLLANIDDRGRVLNLKAVSGPPMLLDSSIVAVRQWHYRPYKLNGQRIGFNTTITVPFRH